MSSSPDKNDCSRVTLIVELVNKQKVSANVTFAEPFPVAFKPVVFPFGSKGAVVGDQQQHNFLETSHVESAGMGQALPVLQKVFRKV